jgi:hypothetical protein
MHGGRDGRYRYRGALKAYGLGWNTRVMNERLEGYRHNSPWRGGLLASPWMLTHDGLRPSA